VEHSTLLRKHAGCKEKHKDRKEMYIRGGRRKEKIKRKDAATVGKKVILSNTLFQY
jgi:hypothetical protein